MRPGRRTERKLPDGPRSKLILFLLLAAAAGYVINRINSESPAPGPPATSRLTVHVSGAVKAPGSYRLPQGSNTGALIGLAGGFLPEADYEALDLSYILSDGARLDVPFRKKSPFGRAPEETYLIEPLTVRKEE